MTTEELYRSLKASGVFWEFFPELTGEWELDRDVFTAQQEKA
jgi:hypothetical protein